MCNVNNTLSPPVVSNIFTQKIVTLTTYDLILSFPDLLLGLNFMGPKVYPILVQLSGKFFLIVTKTYLMLVFLKTRLKMKTRKLSLQTLQNRFLESALHRLSLLVSWMKFWHFSHSCLYKRELVFELLWSSLNKNK